VHELVLKKIHVQSLRFTGKLMLHKIVLVLWRIILAQQASFIITY